MQYDLSLHVQPFEKTGKVGIQTKESNGLVLAELTCRDLLYIHCASSYILYINWKNHHHVSSCFVSLSSCFSACVRLLTNMTMRQCFPPITISTGNIQPKIEKIKKYKLAYIIIYIYKYSPSGQLPFWYPRWLVQRKL